MSWQREDSSQTQDSPPSRKRRGWNDHRRQCGRPVMHRCDRARNLSRQHLPRGRHPRRFKQARLIRQLSQI